MKKTNYLIAGLIALLCFTVHAQEPGYFGKRFFIELGAQGQIPVFQNIFAERGYVEKDGALHKSYNIPDYGFRVALGTIWTENVGVALEYNHRFYQINALRGGELNRQYVDSFGVQQVEYITPQVAFLDVQERMIMPKIVFSSAAGRIPAGLTHEVGVGYSMISIKDNSSMIGYSGANGLTGEDIRANLIDERIDELKGLTFMYGARLNFPVTKSLLLNVGFRYSYAMLFGKRSYRQDEATEAWFSGREAWSRLNQRRQLSIISFGVGATICL